MTRLEKIKTWDATALAKFMVRIERAVAAGSINGYSDQDLIEDWVDFFNEEDDDIDDEDYSCGP